MPALSFRNHQSLTHLSFRRLLTLSKPRFDICESRLIADLIIHTMLEILTCVKESWPACIAICHVLLCMLMRIWGLER